MKRKNKGGSQDLQRNHIPPRILQYIIFPFWCVLNVRTEHDFVSGLCWLNIRENRKKDLQLEKLQKKYILSSSKRQTLLNCSGGLALGFVSWWKRKWPSWGGVWSMRGRWRQLSRRSCRYPITGYHAGNMKAYESYQDRFVLWSTKYFFLQEELDKAKVDDKQ